ncbi:MAG: Fe-S cluster assembly protein SufD [Candidatus Amulumruptor caecigallinarius]|nr:Fe-S cluster assembly protein SufD [Candidatus Amulumruptor caecigallinarius]MCM1397089.1 Fe-S cluster assembly protein SufD [Candidatus Amulumruptor caecigallinarius]MCM1454075.1 Fe-S cluster assembly protein SufD [bacterium]
MSSLKQYIDLYRDNAALIDRGSAPLLNALRPAALRTLQGSRLPDTCDERSRHTSVERMFAPDYGVNIGRVNIPVDIAAAFACNLPHLSPWLGVVVNDFFAPSSTLEGRLPEGVIFASLRKVAAEHPELLEPHLARIAPADDAGVALNTLLMQDGVVLYVPRGVRLAKPLQLVNIFSSPTPLMAARRLLVILEEDAAAQLVVCDHTQDTTQNYLSSQVTEVSLGKGASLDLYTLEEASSSTGRYAQVFVRQTEGSDLSMGYMALAGGVTRNEYTVDLLGEHARASIVGGVLGIGGRHVDCSTAVNHRVPRCESEQTFRYVVSDTSVGVFDGSILVTPDAPFTSAYQSTRNVLASTEARMYSKPRLEIYNDEVKCSHGTTVGQLDETALFYMRSRGIPEHEARVMLMQAFMADAIDSIRIDSLRDRLRHLVELRFSGRDASCRACAE